jgi:hypothetical protein
MVAECEKSDEFQAVELVPWGYQHDDHVDYSKQYQSQRLVDWSFVDQSSVD